MAGRAEADVWLRIRTSDKKEVTEKTSTSATT